MNAGFGMANEKLIADFPTSVSISNQQCLLPVG